MKEFEELKALIESLEDDLAKFVEKNNKTAGTRLSVGMREVINAAKSVRNAVSVIKKQAKG